VSGCEKKGSDPLTSEKAKGSDPFFSQPLSPRIRIGNQTAISCVDRLEPFQFALQNNFDAFEWFSDKKVAADGTVAGWDEDDLDPATRAWIRETGREHDIRFTVHAPWQANPLHSGGNEILLRSLEFASDIDADLVNLHLSMDEGAAGFVQALTPVLDHAGTAGLRLTLENTPHTTPEDFNQTFALLARSTSPSTVGMCLDLGHANLCETTRNDYLRFMDELAPAVPLVHLHVHENFGDADSHLTLFTGPSATDDAAIRGLLQRLYARAYRGVMILEQWPDPPQLLVQAATRLRSMFADGR
jgi:sugar phosphate isomerase/epimerase